MKNNLKNFISKSQINNWLLYTVIALSLISVIFFSVSKISPTKSLGLSPKVKGATSINLPNSPILAPTPIRSNNSKDPNILARHFGLLDVESGSLVYGKSYNDPISIASVTKMMTAMVVIKNYQLDDVIEVPKEATEVIGSKINLKPGERITVISLLNGLLMNSGNDAAFTLASAYPLSQTNASFDDRINSFVQKMNSTANELGLKNTHYKDPAGLNDEGQSTVKDQAILLSYALKNTTFSQIIHKAKNEISSVDSQYTHKLDNSNRLVKEEMLYPGIIGGKTGFTPTAGHSLVTAAERNNHTLVAIIFNTYSSNASASALEARKLLDWGFNNITWEKNILIT